MSLGHPIQLRLELDKQFFYQEEAAKQGKSLVSYLRGRLAQHDETLEALTGVCQELLSLRLMIEEKSATANTASSPNEDSTLLEILLLLRQLCRPEHLKIAQGELNRLGFSVRQW